MIPILTKVFSVVLTILLLLVPGGIAEAGEYVPEVGRTVRPRMKVLEVEERDGYECRLVEYAVDDSYVGRKGRKGRTIRKTERIKGYLLVPEAARKGRCPALVMLHDHGARFDIGKEKLVRPMAGMLQEGADDHIYKSSHQWVNKNFDGVYLADSLASLGYVVLVSDALYWGDRSSPEAHRWSELTYGQPEHRTVESDRNYPAKARKDTLKTLKGRVYEGQRIVYAGLKEKGVIWAEKILRDDIASVKLLAGLPYVDRKRIGAFGFSMGAHRCWLLAAFCKEVRYGVALSWMTTLEGYDGKNASDLSMRIQPMRDYMDFGDIGLFLAPKPMLFLSGDTDHLFPKDTVQSAFRKLRSHYSASEASRSDSLRASDRLRTEFFPGGHHCGRDVQKTIIQAFRMML